MLPATCILWAANFTGRATSLAKIAPICSSNNVLIMHSSFNLSCRLGSKFNIKFIYLCTILTTRLSTTLSPPHTYQSHTSHTQTHHTHTPITTTTPPMPMRAIPHTCLTPPLRTPISLSKLRRFVHSAKSARAITPTTIRIVFLQKTGPWPPLKSTNLNFQIQSTACCCLNCLQMTWRSTSPATNSGTPSTFFESCLCVSLSLSVYLILCMYLTIYLSILKS